MRRHKRQQQHAQKQQHGLPMCFDCTPPRDGTNITAAARHVGVRQRGTAVVIVRGYCTHATQRRHRRGSGGTVVAAGGRGPSHASDLDEISCPAGPRFFFNFSKLLFCFCPIPGCVRRRSQATRCSRVVCSGKKWQPAGCAVDDNPLAIVTQLKQERHARARQSGLFRLGGGRRARVTSCAPMRRR